MREVIAVAAVVGLGLVWGGVQAKNFDDGVELGTKGVQTGGLLGNSTQKQAKQLKELDKATKASAEGNVFFAKKC